MTRSVVYGPSVTLDAGGNKWTNLANGVSASDAATVGQLGGGGGGATKLYDYEVSGSDKASIDTFVDGTTVANFAGYDVLEVWLYARTDETAGISAVTVLFNNDSGANYDRHGLFGSNTTMSTSVALAQSAAQLLCPGASCSAGVFGVARMTIPNYAGTVGQKTWENVSTFIDQSAANTVTESRNWNWRSTSALTRLSFAPSTALKKFKVGTRLLVFAL